MGMRRGVSFDEIDSAAQYADRNIEALERLASLDDGVINAIVMQAAKAAEPIARQAIAQNKESAGIGSDTGTLDANIKKIRVIPKISGGKFALVVAFPSQGAKKYSGGGSEKFYRVASSLNNGYVRTPKVMRTTGDIIGGNARTGVRQEIASKVGSRAKRRIKKYALSGDISDRAKNAIEKNRKFRTGVETVGVDISGRKEGKKSIEVGEATVVRPKEFFKLSPSQERAILKIVLDKIADLILGEMNRTARG